MSLEYRKINFPKIDWNERDEDIEPELSEEIIQNLEEDLNTITNKKSINPHEIKDGLRSINFHKEQPELYKMIEEMCLEYDLKEKI